MKKILTFLLVFAILVSFSACGGKTPADETEPTFEDESVTASPIVSPEIGRNEGKFNIDHEFVFEDQPNVPLFVADGIADAPATGDILIKIADGTYKNLFTLVLRVPMDAPPDEFQGVYMVSLYFSHDDLYLLGVIPQETDTESFYLYDNVNKTLSLVGKAQELRFLGKTFMLRDLYMDETERSEVRVFSKNAEPLCVYADVYDMELYEKTLYLLTGADPAELRAIPQERFFEDAPELTPDVLCEFPGYQARFGFAEYGKITLIKTDSADLKLLTLSEALLYADELKLQSAEGNDPITESCGLFSVTLPGMFKDRYICEKTETEMLFYQKAAKEADGSGFLFGFACVTSAQAQDAANQRNRLVYCRYLRGDDESYIAVQLPTDNPDYDYLDEFVPLRDSRENVTASLQAADGAELQAFDYSALVDKTYTGNTEAGVWTLTFTAAESYRLRASLRLEPGEGDPQETQLIILMLQTGRLVFEDGEDVGYGELSPEGDGWLLTLNGTADSWLHTEEPIRLR